MSCPILARIVIDLHDDRVSRIVEQLLRLKMILEDFIFGNFPSVCLCVCVCVCVCLCVCG